MAEHDPDDTQQVGQEYSKPHGRTARCLLHSLVGYCLEESPAVLIQVSKD